MMYLRKVRGGVGVMTAVLHMDISCSVKGKVEFAERNIKDRLYELMKAEHYGKLSAHGIYRKLKGDS